MTSTADRLPDSAPLPRDLLSEVRDERRASDRSEVRIMELAVEYAYANPALPGQEAWAPTTLPVWTDPHSYATTEPEHVEWYRLPSLRWDAPAAFAAANGMSTVAGKAVIRDALVLTHRAPAVRAAMCAGQITVRRARRIAEQLLGQHDDVCRYVNDALAERLEDGRSIGPVVAERLVEEAMLRLHAEERELDQLEALDRRHVTIDPASINHNGVGDLDARLDCVDLLNLDQTVAELAVALKDLPEYEHESLDVRRSIALGILGDPARAQAILDGRTDAKPSTRRELVADLHLTEGSLLLGDPVVTDTDLKAHLTQVIQTWVGRPDIALTIRGIRHCGGTAGGCAHCPAEIDCTNHTRHATEDYVPTQLDRTIVELAARRCVHPFCNRSARRCDCDHIKPFDSGGPTCPRCNLAPLCRHHHRLKTHAGWRYWKLGPESYLWTDPHGLLYLRERDGTRQLD